MGTSPSSWIHSIVSEPFVLYSFQQAISKSHCHFHETHLPNSYHQGIWNYSVSFNISQLPLGREVLVLDIGRCRLAPQSLWFSMKSAAAALKISLSKKRSRPINIAHDSIMYFTCANGNKIQIRKRKKRGCHLFKGYKCRACSFLYMFVAIKNTPEQICQHYIELPFVACAITY
jgi:hypothetical protein